METATENLELVKHLTDFANGPLTALNELAAMVPINDESGTLLTMVNERVQSDYQKLFTDVLQALKSAQLSGMLESN